LLVVKRLTLGRALHLDKPAAASHHHIHVGLGHRIVVIMQIKSLFASDYPNTYCSYRIS
jgi:hypothetical protein